MWLEPVHIIKVNRSESNLVDSLTESALLALGDDIDAEAGACALVEGTCNSERLEQVHKRQP